LQKEQIKQLPILLFAKDRPRAIRSFALQKNSNLEQFALLLFAKKDNLLISTLQKERPRALCSFTLFKRSNLLPKRARELSGQHFKKS